MNPAMRKYDGGGGQTGAAGRMQKRLLSQFLQAVIARLGNTPAIYSCALAPADLGDMLIWLAAGMRLCRSLSSS